MNKVIFFMFFLLIFVACKNEKKEAEVIPNEEVAVETIEEVKEVDSGLNENPIELPDPCSLITKDELEELFQIDARTLNYKTSNTSQGQEFNKSCFITWQENGDASGFLVQVMKNPLYGEFHDWATSYINVLSTNGEMSFPDNVPHVYKSFEGLGDEGVYNKELGKMYWRKGDELIIGLIFRSDKHKNKVKSTGVKVGKVMMQKVL